MHYIFKLIAFSSASLWFANVIAAPMISTEQIQVPSCLARHISSAYPVLAENQQFKILDVPSADLDGISRLAEKVHCGRFVNVSEELTSIKALTAKDAAAFLLKKPLSPTRSVKPAEYSVSHPREVRTALQLIVQDNIWQTLATLSSFTNRSATVETGVKTADWLKTQFESMAVEYGRHDTATYFVATGGSYLQPSLVTVLGKDIKAPAVVIGAHMDTLGATIYERLPGADDDGSGSASVMEMARVLLESKIKLSRPVYIIWYSAEERGLVGSQQVVKYFKEKAIPVYAAIQFDMTGFRVNDRDKTMWVFNDYTNKALNDFITQLIKTYVNVPVGQSKCGYGCSDHASWTAAGIPASFACETSFEDHNPYIHQITDTIGLLSLDHMTNFTKLGVAFAIELAS